MQPHWKTKHDWWIEDFQYFKDLKTDLAELVRKHPDLDDNIGNILRTTLKNIDKKITEMKKKYKKIYGVNFNMRVLK